MYKYFKNFADYLLSITILLIFSPIIFITFFTILIFDRVNPIFLQNRSGQNQKSFKIFKFNSMKIINGTLTITKIGKIIRKFKIDELLQLFNILRNEMSLIGPRPLYSDFDPYYQNSHLERFNVKPGITGLAQVKIYDSTNWRNKFKYDVFYVNNLSLYLDVVIVFQTVKLLYFSFLNKRKIIEVIDYKESFFSKYAKK